MLSLNYKHLHYFWVVAQEGSMTRAAERLGVAVQTVSAQVALLEQSLGRSLLRPAGRGLVLTEAGQMTFRQADKIFQLGDRLRDELAHLDSARRLRVRVGITDGIPKLLAHRLLAVMLAQPEGVRLVCEEDEFDDLLADLALHRLDLVLTDRPAPGGGQLKVFSAPLGNFAMTLFGARALAARWQAADWPACLQDAPMLLPSRHHLLRDRIDHWFASHGVRPDVVGEFEDDALLNTFGRAGLGLFPAPRLLAGEIAAQLDAVPVGDLDGVSEQLYAITAERRIGNPAVEALIAGGADLAAEA